MLQQKLFTLSFSLFSLFFLINNILFCLPYLSFQWKSIHFAYSIQIRIFASTSFLGGLWNGRLIMHQQDVCHPFLSIPIYIFLLFHCILYYRFILVYIRSKNRPFLLIYRDAIDTMVEYIFTERFSFQVEYINILSTIHLDAFPCILGYFFKRTSVKDGINGTVRHLHIAEAHDARRNAITF